MPFNSSKILINRARKLVKEGLSRAALKTKTKLDITHLEDRSVPNGTYTGTVFQDFNGNGIQDLNQTIANKGAGTVQIASDLAVQGVTVTMYNATGQVGVPVQTNAAGQFSINTGAAVGPFRVEFTGLPAGFTYGTTSTSAGPATRVVADGGLTGVNLSLMKGEDFSINNPLVATNLYHFGASNGPNANSKALVGFNYDSGASDNQNGFPNAVQALYQSPNTQELSLTHNQVGTTWGLGYNRITGQVYAGAFFKKHSGIGPGGIDAIYAVTNNTSPAQDTANVYVNLNSIYAGAAGNANFRNGANYDFNFDSGNTGWDAVGKTGLGGLDVDPSGTTIFTVGLGDRRFYTIPTTGPLNSTTVRQFNLPIPATVTGRANVNDPNDYGDMRPFAVTYYNGKVYIGAVNTAESTTNGGTVVGDRTALRAYVFSFDPVTGQFVDLSGTPSTAPVATYNLNYSRGIAHPGDNRAPGQTADDESAVWNPWTPTFRTIGASGSNRGIYPQPWLTGLAFDNAGNMTLGVRDRAGDQFGRYTNDDPANPGFTIPNLYYGIAAGDTLKAFGNTTAGWTLENNANGGAGQNNGQGPGSGEFYYQDNLPQGINGGFGDPAPDPRNGPNDHDEVSLGGIYHLPGTPDVMSTVFDAARVSNIFNTGGVRWFNNTAGNNVKAYELYSTTDTDISQPPRSTFAKGNGLGDLVALTTTPPLEIGDYVWNDTNANGIQDPNETGRAGVVLSLFGAGADNKFGTADDPVNPIATVTTDADGGFLFSNLANATTTSKAYGLTINPNTNYQIRFALAQPALLNRNLTKANNDATANGTLRDSNAIVSGLNGVVSVTTGGVGASDHSLDIGIVRGPTFNLGNFVWDDANNDGIFNGAEVGINDVTVQLLDSNNQVIANQKTVNGNYLFTDLDPASYTVQIVNNTLPVGYTSSTGQNGNAVSGPFEPSNLFDTGNNTDHGTKSGSLTTGKQVTITNADILTQDFGFFQAFSIGNLVWEDINNNGKLDGAEKGVSGVTVELLDGAGNLIAGIPSQKTTNTGGYQFDGLAAGNYRVRITAPTGYVSSTGSNGGSTGFYEPTQVLLNANEEDHGNATTPNGSTILGPVVDLSVLGNRPDGTVANFRQDFGIYRPMSLGNFVFEDTNNDGVFQSATEKGIANVSLILRDEAGVQIGSTTTNSQGGYLFTNLTPGKYRVEVDLASLPAGYVTSTGKNGSTTGAYEPVTAPDVDSTDHGSKVGAVVQGALIDMTAYDTQPTDEAATPGGIADPATNANANYRQDFSFFRPLSIGDLVWGDLNNDGTFNAGTESGIDKVAVDLYSGNTLIASTTTGANGDYLFNNLVPGSYQVRITAPNSTYVSSTGGNTEPGISANTNNVDHGTNGTPQITGPTITLGLPGDTTLNPSNNGTANLTQDFGLWQPLQLGNRVWIDANNDGIYQNTEAAVPNYTVRLLDGNLNLLATTKTGPDGIYNFGNLLPGTYFVEVDKLTGFISSSGTPNSDTGPFEPATNTTVDETDHGSKVAGNPLLIRSGPTILGTPGNTQVNPSLNGFGNLTQDFGFTPELANAKLSGFVYIDPNINGKIDTGEKFIPTTRITLNGTDLGGNTITRTTFTNKQGFYEFTQLPAGKYTVTESQPPGLFDGLDTPGTVGSTLVTSDKLQVVLANNDNSQQNNFGEIPPTNLFGYVYEDLNRNGFRDPGEPGISGVSVNITSGTAFPGSVLQRPVTAADVPGGFTAITDANGYWSFVLMPPGTYSVAEVQPAEYADFLESNLDPSGLPVGTISSALNTDFFTAITGPSDFNRGPFNFGEVRSNSPTKRDFLGSTPGATPPPTIPVLQQTPSFGTTAGTTANPTFVAIGSGPGQAPLVRVLDYTNGFERRILAYESAFTGGVRVAMGDVNGDGVEDLITGIGAGGGPRIRVLSGTDLTTVLFDQFVYEPTFTGGLFVAAADYDGDGRADIITGTDTGGGPRVRVLSGTNFSTLADFFAFDPNQRGGVRVAAADFNNDGRADLVTTAGGTVQTRIRIFDSKTGGTLADYSPYTAAYTGGVFVATGDFNGDGTPDVIAGADVGGGPHVQVFSGLTTNSLASFFAYSSTFTGGVRVGATDINGDGKADIFTIPGAGGNAHVRAFRGTDLSSLENFFAFGGEFLGGAYVS